MKTYHNRLTKLEQQLLGLMGRGRGADLTMLTDLELERIIAAGSVAGLTSEQVEHIARGGDTPIMSQRKR